MTNPHVESIERQIAIVVAEANLIAILASQQAGIAAKMEAHLGMDHNIGGRASKPFSEIETAAMEIQNRLIGLDMHFRALR